MGWRGAGVGMELGERVLLECFCLSFGGGGGKIEIIVGGFLER